MALLNCFRKPQMRLCHFGEEQLCRGARRMNADGSVPKFVTKPTSDGIVPDTSFLWRSRLSIGTEQVRVTTRTPSKVMPRKRNTHQESFPFDRLQLETYSSNDFASSADTLQFNGFFVCGWQQKRKSNNHEIRTEFLQKSNFAKDGTHYIRRIQFQKCYSRIAPS